MSVYKRILVLINPTDKQQPALSRAIELAEKFGSHITLLSCIYDVNYEYTHVLNKDERKSLKEALLTHELKALHALVQEYQMSEISNVEVIWHKKLYQGAVDVARKHDCDLIVKATKAHSKIMQRIFTPNDWNLLRYSPVNVLMVKDHEWPQNGKMIAAISINDSDDEHTWLSKQVASEAMEMARMFEADLHLVNTYLGAPAHISIEVPQFSADTYNANVLQQHTAELNKIADSIKLSHDCVHVKEGLPEDIIPDICARQDAELLILGSVGRKGLPAALLGNTAEHIVDSINCDTLVVKPK